MVRAFAWMFALSTWESSSVSVVCFDGLKSGFSVSHVRICFGEHLACAYSDTKDGRDKSEQGLDKLAF